ncbi:MAG: alpha/beta hydrolase [Pseudomonadota bacterium]
MSDRTRLPGTPEPMVKLPGSGLEIAADHWGKESDPLVVLLHGGGQTRHAWKGTGETLASTGLRTYSLDSRGHGDSDWSQTGDYEQDTMVKDLVSVVNYLDDPNPILVGASMGGGVALCAIGEGHLAARALILVDMAPRIEPEGAEKILQFMSQSPDGFDSLEDVAEAIATYQPHRQRTRALDGLKKNVRLDKNGRLRWHWDPNWLSDKPRLGDIDARFERLQRAAKVLADTKIPTLLVRGGLSDVLSEEGAQSFLDTCPHAQYVNVTDAAHMVAGDRNDIFTSAVEQFIEGLGTT